MRMADTDDRLNIAVLADDLTGAVDCAATFLGRAHPVYVAIGPELPPTPRGALSLNLDTRRLPPNQAGPVAAASAATVAALQPAVTYVKVDSTMRGHPGCEIAAAARALGAKCTVATPAFPENGRTVSGGLLRVDGRLVTETDVGKDPLSPVPFDRVADVLRLDCSLPVTELPLADVRSARLPAILASAADSASSVLVCDAETESDLTALAAAGLAADGGKILFAGSAGLAAALARQVPASPAPATPPNPAPESGQVLVVTASQRDLVDRQLSAAEDSHGLTVHTIRFTMDASGNVTVDGDDAPDPDGRSAPAPRPSAMRARLTFPSTSISPQAMRTGASRLTEMLGRLIGPSLLSRPPAALVIIGGDTALGVLAAVRARGIVLRAEPLPGVPAGIIDGGELDGTVIATKAGAFGDDHTISRLLTYLGSLPNTPR